MSEDDWGDEVDDPDKDNLPGTIVPLQLLPEIGAVAVRYSNLDWALNFALRRLLGLTEERAAAIIQVIQNYASRAELLRTLAVQKYPDQQERVAQIVAQLRYAGDDRNRLMHDAIGSSQLGDDYAAIGTFRNLSIEPHIFDTATMKDLQWRMWRLHDVLWDLADDDPDWISVPLPSLEKSPTLLLRKKHEEKQRQGKPPRQQ